MNTSTSTNPSEQRRSLAETISLGVLLRGSELQSYALPRLAIEHLRNRVGLEPVPAVSQLMFNSSVGPSRISLLDPHGIKAPRNGLQPCIPDVDRVVPEERASGDLDRPPTVTEERRSGQMLRQGQVEQCCEHVGGEQEIPPARSSRS
jgi:hypothetical protein